MCFFQVNLLYIVENLNGVITADDAKIEGRLTAAETDPAAGAKAELAKITSALTAEIDIALDAPNAEQRAVFALMAAANALLTDGYKTQFALTSYSPGEVIGRFIVYEIAAHATNHATHADDITFTITTTFVPECNCDTSHTLDPSNCQICLCCEADGIPQSCEAPDFCNAHKPSIPDTPDNPYNPRPNPTPTTPTTPTDPTAPSNSGDTGRNLGEFDSLEDLIAANSNPETGDYAYIGNSIYTWNGTEWVLENTFVPGVPGTPSNSAQGSKLGDFATLTDLENAGLHPSIGDYVTVNGARYTWDGTGWIDDTGNATDPDANPNTGVPLGITAAIITGGAALLGHYAKRKRSN